MSLRIDLNADLGEGFGVWRMGEDEALLARITSANVACGFHASDPVTMARTVRAAARLGVAVGAHPGYPDLVGFGRRDLEMSPEEAEAAVIYQIGALRAFCEAEGVPLHHVKPHGAMYNRAARDRRLAEAIARAVRRVDPRLILYAQPGGELARAGEEAGLRVALEAFADRAYLPDGRLQPRSQPGAVFHDPEEVAERALSIVRDGRIASVTGEEVELRAETLCLHGDNPEAIRLAEAVRRRLEAAGVEIAPVRA
ncbi:MAG: 5-oxoprolinase subunit PxpA [Bacillota bacterium]|nr:5-oxoprolinase subunit PxpA [Bacillota bacterium]